MRDKLSAALAYVRTHKAQVSALSVIAIGLAARYVPGFPSDEVTRVIGVLLGIA